MVVKSRARETACSPHRRCCMQESWHRYLRLGIVHFMAFPSVLRGEGPFVDTLRQIARDEFFTAVETGWVHSDAERAAAAALLRVCAYGRGRGIGITLETFDRTIEKKALAGPTRLCVSVSEAVRRDFPDFGLMLDLSHIPLLAEGIRECLTVGREHLVHAHIGNCVMRDRAHPAYGDQHPRFGIEGGENDTPQVVEFLRVLFDIGFLGGTERPFLSFEVKPLAREPSQGVIAGTKRVFAEAWAQL